MRASLLKGGTGRKLRKGSERLWKLKEPLHLLSEYQFCCLSDAEYQFSDAATET
jgi:hypothetical protein